MTADANPLLGKMDALMKKHRGAPETPDEAAPPPGWLPVLTDVVKRGTPLAPAVAEAPSPQPSPACGRGSERQAQTDSSPIVPATGSAETPSASVIDSLAEQLMSELAPRLSEVMEKQVAAELRKNLDETVAALLSQLDVNVREIVRDAVAEKLKAPKADS